MMCSVPVDLPVARAISRAKRSLFLVCGAGQRGLALVCVQPLLVYRVREGEDLTFDKSDPKDAVIIARLAYLWFWSSGGVAGRGFRI